MKHWKTASLKKMHIPPQDTSGNEMQSIEWRQANQTNPDPGYISSRGKKGQPPTSFLYPGLLLSLVYIIIGNIHN
ncbi:hypothetical protein ES705_06685 [subsurface metagenome]